MFRQDFRMTLMVLSSAATGSLPESDYADIVLHVSARILSAVRARRKANGWLAMEAGDRLLAGVPELVIDEQLRWRVPVHWTSPTKGVLTERVYDLMMDAVTGEVPDQKTQIEEIQRRVAEVGNSAVTGRPHGPLPMAGSPIISPVTFKGSDSPLA